MKNRITVFLAVQAGVMLGDVLSLAALLILARYDVVLSLILMVPTWYAHKRTGGWFMAWNPRYVRALWRNLHGI